MVQWQVVVDFVGDCVSVVDFFVGCCFDDFLVVFVYQYGVFVQFWLFLDDFKNILFVCWCIKVKQQIWCGQMKEMKYMILYYLFVVYQVVYFFGCWCELVDIGDYIYCVGGCQMMVDWVNVVQLLNDYWDFLY